MAEGLERVEEGALVPVPAPAPVPAPVPVPVPVPPPVVPDLEMGLQAGYVSAWIRISDGRLAAYALGGVGVGVGVGLVGLAAFVARNPWQVINVITRGLGDLGQALNFRAGSIVFELRCYAELFSRLSLESFTAEIKQRVEKSLQEIGFLEELEVSIMNIQELYDRVNRLRYAYDILFYHASYDLER